MRKRSTTREFIEKATIKHNGYYDYSLVEYIGDKVKIICPKHGIFEQTPNNHLFGQRCIWCMGDAVSKAKKYTKEQWIKNFRKRHGNKYNYSLVEVTEESTSNDKTIIICPKHGEFLQSFQDHSGGQNCPYCRISHGEERIELFLIRNKIKYNREYRIDKCRNPKTNRKLPFDFYLPKYNLLIEYQGEQHYRLTGYYKSNGNLKDNKFRDDIKKKYCKQNKINYLEIVKSLQISSLPQRNATGVIK